MFDYNNERACSNPKHHLDFGGSVPIKGEMRFFGRYVWMMRKRKIERKW